MKIELSKDDIVVMVKKAFPEFLPYGYKIENISREYGDVIVEILPRFEEGDSEAEEEKPDGK